MAFDGTNLYYTIVGNTNIFEIDALGNCLGAIPVDQQFGRIQGGPLAWDGTGLWTMDYSVGSFTLYKVNPADGSITSSCNIATQNPGHAAVTGSPRNIGEQPDGLDYTGTSLWVSSEVFAGNWVVEVDLSCNILQAFNPPVTGSFGTSGVEFHGLNLWHSNAHFNQFQTDLTGIQLEDLACDRVTFPGKAALWANQATGGGNLITAYEVASCNQPPTADPNGPYLGPVAGITFDGAGSSDPDGDPLSYDWDFGDGNTASNTPTPTHSYAEAGIYGVCLTVTDAAGGTDTACTFAVVYDPDGGFVTGGGWIDSRPGAYRPEPELYGKATFGFVSKYKKGATTPTGNTEFQFQTANLNFHSSSYDWLVVNGQGDRAMFKGMGTINGYGSYNFMLWAGDDDPDTFRIRIWEENANGAENTENAEDVIYDNQDLVENNVFGQPLGGGSIVIHKK
jgi:hypothetical protein